MTKITVSREAARWYKNELDLEDGDYIQFTVNLYGQSIHPNYSLGITREPPQDMSTHTVVEEITFYFEKQDDWFLQDHHLFVDLEDEDIVYRFEEADPSS